MTLYCQKRGLKKQKIVERQKAEAIAAKRQKNRRDISLSNEKNDKFYSNTDDMDPNQKNNLNQVQGHNGGKGAEDDTD